MRRAPDVTPSESIFHEGERAVQGALGVADIAGRIGTRMVRDHLTLEHRQFFQRLPFVVVSTRDHEGNVWASLVCGEPGFAHVTDDTHLALSSIDLRLLGLRAGDDIAVLGIELETRRRNRENGIVEAGSGDEVLIRVVQSYGNCPKYIPPRIARYCPERGAGLPAPSPTATRLTSEMVELIRSADTFFIATGHGQSGAQPNRGLDVSHRGGPPGFVEVRTAPDELVIPDYPGNNMFNTLGNLSLDPRAGLTFIDFDSAAMLQMTGTARADLASAPDTANGNSEAPRLLHFTPRSGRWVRELGVKFSLRLLNP